MTDLNELAELASRLRPNFTGPIGHDAIVELARFWLPDVNFHEAEMFHSIDLEELYTVPPREFADFDPQTRQEFAITVEGVPATPPVIRLGGDLRGAGDGALAALEQSDVDEDAVYTHGGNVRAADKFFGSATTRDGTPVPGVGNPRLPREGLRVRVEFRMLLETLKHDLALEAEDVEKPIDAIWGEFDVTDLLLRRVDPETGRDAGAASGPLRRDFARDLIREHEAGNTGAVEDLLASPPPDGDHRTRVNRTVWLALKTCGLLEYHFIYAYNDFFRYGGFFTNEHEGDNEGCCLVFERERLLALEQGADPATIPPLGLITSAHNESNRADDARPVDADPGDARDGLDVFVAVGSHATYLEPGVHDFFDVSDLFRERPGLFTLGVIAAILIHPLLLPILLIWEHFSSDPDRTSEDGVTGQTDVNPASDPLTHLPVELVVTPLSADRSIYDLSQVEPRELALRAFRGRLGNHDGFIDKSPRWENRTRRYFKMLIGALESDRFRDPLEPFVVR